MLNMKMVSVTLAAALLIGGTGYVMATESGRVDAGKQALYTQAAGVAQSVTGAIEPKAVLSVEMQCKTGPKTETKELAPEQVSAETLKQMVDDGCMMTQNGVGLNMAVPDVQGAEGVLKGDGFRDGKAKVTVTTAGSDVTVQVDATAKAGVLGKEITATAQSEVSGEGVKQNLAENLKAASVEAAPVIAQKSGAVEQVNKVVVEEKPTPAAAPANQPKPTTTKIAPPPANQVISQEKLDRFGTIPVTKSKEATEAEIMANKKKKW